MLAGASVPNIEDCFRRSDLIITRASGRLVSRFLCDANRPFTEFYKADSKVTFCFADRELVLLAQLDVSRALADVKGLREPSMARVALLFRLCCQSTHV